MERRRFLRNLTIATTAAILPLKFLDKVLEEGTAAEVIQPCNLHGQIHIDGDWEIDYQTRTLIYKGGWKDDGINLDEMYNYLQEEWDEEIAEFPMEKRGKYTYIINELTLQTT